VDELSDNPAGIVPAVTDHDMGEVPDAANVCENADACVSDAKAVVVIVGAEPETDPVNA
jgi:hypothetical protein